MNFNIRQYEKSDFNMIASWWKTKTDVEINRVIESEYGYIVSLDDKDICAMFLYPTKGSKIAWIGWPIADPESDKDDRSTALDLLFDIAHSEAESMGYKAIWTTSKSSAVEDRLKKHNYIKGDTGINQYWRNL